MSDNPKRRDFTRPIAVDRQLVTRRSNRWLLALAAVGVIGALAAAFFVIPVQSWLRQQEDIDEKRAELAVIEDANAQLVDEVGRLQTAEGAKEAARDELGVVDAGEQRISVLPSGDAPLTLPVGWPYDTVTAIVAARGNMVATAAAAVPTTVAP